MDERIAQMKRLEGEKKMSKVSMKGVIDMHVHTNPDLRLRAYDDFEMMEAGIRVAFLFTYNAGSFEALTKQRLTEEYP